MIEEPFADKQTWVHALDPRLRVCTAFFLSCLFTITTKPSHAVCALIASSLLLTCSRPPLFPLFRRLAAVNLFILFLWVTVPFFTPGTPIVQFGPFFCTREGLRLVWLITLKANSISLLLIACVGTMPVSLFGHALHALRLPDKFVFLLLFTYRSLFLLADEWQRLQISLRLRNFVAGTNLHTYRTFGYLLGLTLVRSLDRARRIRQAMLLRGFNGRFASFTLLRFRRQDFFFLIVVLFFFCCFLGEISIFSDI